MKKFFTQKINIVHAVIVILTLVVGVSSVAAVSPGGNITPIIHRGGGNQVMDYLRIGTGNLLGNLSVRDNKTLAHFTGDITDPSAVFRVGDNALVRNQLFVGNNVSASQNNIWNTSYITTNGTIGAALQAVNVLGTARATNLDSIADGLDNVINGGIPVTNQSGSDKVCIDRQGGLRLCPDTPPVQINGQCGAAQGATLSGVPAANLLCVNGLPSNYTFQSDGTTAWTCFGENDGTDASCTANQPMGVCGTAGSETFAVYPDDGDACPFFGGNDGQLLIHSLSPLVGICMPENHPESLCAEGDASDVTFDSDLSIASWTCSNGGATEVSCNSDRVTIEPEPEPVSPQCAEFPGIHESQPADETNGCDSGEFADLDNSDTEFLWECQGINGGDSVSCSAAMEIECLAPTLTSLVCPNEVNFTLNGATNVIATSIYSSTNGTAWSGGNTGSEVSPRNIDLIDGNYYRMQSICSGSVFSPDSNVLKYSASTCDDPPNDPGPASCHPLIYPEVTGSFSVIAENYCSGRPTQTECMYSNSYWWNQSVDGQGLYGNPVLSTPLTGGYETFAAHSYGQVGVNSGFMAADSGLNLDLTGQTLPSNIDAELNPCTVSSNFQCQRILGPVCIWRS